MKVLLIGGVGDGRRVDWPEGAIVYRVAHPFMITETTTPEQVLVDTYELVQLCSEVIVGVWCHLHNSQAWKMLVDGYKKEAE